ncbi:MAG: hypothetical protein P8101_15335 [Candidatus Thiodiazotropha sp.]|jgi:hypothetical protein
MNAKEKMQDNELPVYEVEEVSAAELIADMKRSSSPTRESSIVRALERMQALSKREAIRH